MNKKKIHPYHTKKDIPLVSLDQLKEARTRTNKLNKSRASGMERRVATFLCGYRMPMSGAIKGYKGDGKIEIADRNHFLLECKLSEQEHHFYGPVIPFTANWFRKHESDTKAMNCLFGIFILHYHQVHGDYVLWNINDVQIVLDRYSDKLNFTEDVQYLLTSSIILDYRFKKNGESRRTYNIFRKNIEEAFMTTPGLLKGCILRSDIGDYLIISLIHYKNVIERLLLCEKR